MRRFRLPNPSTLTERSLRTLYERMRPVIVLKDKGNTRAALERTLDVLNSFFTRLGKPNFQHVEIRAEDPVKAEDINDRLNTIVDDLKAGYSEVDSLRNSTIETHNYESLHVAELQHRADTLSSMVTDLRLVSGQLGDEVLVFSDNFMDESKLDAAFPVEGLEAEVAPGQGSMTLARVSSNSVTVGDADVKVSPIGSLGREPNADNVGRFYEGHFYSFLGEAEPEGGVFHLEEQLNKQSLQGITQQAMQVPSAPVKPGKGATKAEKKAYKAALKQYKKDLKDFVAPDGQEALFLEELSAGLFQDKLLDPKKAKKFINKQRKKYHKKDRVLRKEYMYLANNPDVADQNGIDLTPDAPLGPENYIIMDTGATEQELADSRSRMLDGDPASYWQCELVRSTSVLQDDVDKKTAETGNASVAPGDLRQLASSADVDKEDFEVELLFTLRAPRQVNWITLNPLTFDDGAYVEVTELSTAPDMESPFVAVESFASQRFSNILTDEANEELPKDTASYLLAPNKQSYRGTGVWPFASRDVQQVRIRLKQRTPVPNPYERIVLEITRTLTSRIK